MSYYEHTFITKGDLTEKQNKKLIDKYENIINKNLGKVLKTEEWGLRTLAHKIKNNKKGFYFHIKIEGNRKTIEDLHFQPKRKLQKYLFFLQMGLKSLLNEKVFLFLI